MYSNSCGYKKQKSIVLIKKLFSKNLISGRNAIIKLLFNKTCKSITPDRGTECPKHQEIIMNLNIPFFILKPICYLGKEEQMKIQNGLIRYFI